MSAIWGVHSHGGTPIAGWFIMENPMKMNDEMSYPHFRKPPYVTQCVGLVAVFLAMFASHLKMPRYKQRRWGNHVAEECKW